MYKCFYFIYFMQPEELKRWIVCFARWRQENGAVYNRGADYRPHVWINNTFQGKIVNIFLPISFNICFCAQKNNLIETVLLSTHNICFGWEIRKLNFRNALLTKVLTDVKHLIRRRKWFYDSINKAILYFHMPFQIYIETEAETKTINAL